MSSFRAMRWTCHVCGDERPDAKISVSRHFHTVRGIQVQENIRHCNDNMECVARAAELSFFEGSQ